MPYRRLPNTEQARLRSLQMAVEEGERVNYLDLPYSYSLKNEAANAMQQIEQALHTYQIALDSQVVSGKKYVSDLKTARLYISHFIQVLNMSVQRGEIKKTMKPLYGLSIDDYNVPDLSTEESVVVWGERIIKGEEQRLNKSGSPIYNPSIAKVKAIYDIFLESKSNQKNLQFLTRRATERLEELHATVDPLILKIWNQVEEHYRNLPAEERRKRCAAFGICYYLRKGEKDALQASEEKSQEE